MTLLNPAVRVQVSAQPSSTKSSLGAYLKRVKPTTAENSEKSVESEGESNSSSQTPSGLVKISLDNATMSLKSGIGQEEAKEIKLLFLYLSLGCPSTIKFVYDYSYPNDRIIDECDRGLTNGLR